MSTGIAVGQQVAHATYPIQRINLVMYAGASGDFNPIHWNEAFAQSVGLPNVIAHGMFTMAEAMRAVTDWLGDPGLVESCSARFTAPVPVPDDATGAVVDVSVTVADLLDDGRAMLLVTAQSDETTVLEGTATVNLPTAGSS